MINDVVHIRLRIDCDIYRNILLCQISACLYNLSHDNGVKSNSLQEVITFYEKYITDMFLS